MSVLPLPVDQKWPWYVLFDNFATYRGSIPVQEAADLILLNDFSSIITGIKYGRLCFENLRKTILYLLPAG